jgi:hypothetical protein
MTGIWQKLARLIQVAGIGQISDRRRAPSTMDR